MTLTESSYGKVKKGDVPPQFSLKGIDEKMWSLEEFRGKPTLVVFMCNHCPYVKHKIGAIVALAKEFIGRVHVVGINANDAANYPDDSFEGMQAFAKEQGINFPYLVNEVQDVAQAWGATCTPDPFLLDKELRLVYHGRIDDGIEPGSVAQTSEMRDAIVQLLAGNQVTIQELPSLGCNIKWAI